MVSENFKDWLLAAPTPSIRYLTLRHLLDQPETDANVQAARRDIMASGPVPVILAKQTDSGQWADEHSYYTPKYVSTHWSMLLLDEFAADGNDPRFRQGVEFMLGKTRQWLEQATTERKAGWTCLWGNILRYAVHGGYADDPRTQAVVSYLLLHSLQGEVCHCEYNANLACAWGAARTLWGLAALPPSYRPDDYEASVRHALKFLLESFSLIEANYPTPGKIHPIWFSLNFPLFYQTDILFVLRALADLDALNHPGAQPALDWLEVQRDKSGRWRGSGPYRSRTWKGLAGVEETSRWVSLHAAMILRQAGRTV